MKTIKYYLCLTILISGLINLNAQDSLSLKNGRINTVTGEKIIFKNLAFENKQFKYYDNKSSAVNYLNLDKILKVEEKSGTHALDFGLGLGAAGLVGSILATMNLSSKQQKSTFIISYTSVCVLVGLIWGSTQAKYKTVYVNPQYGFINYKSDYPLNVNSYALNRYKVYPR